MTASIKLHLTVYQPNAAPDTSGTQAGLWNPQRTEFVWNTDFSAFRPVALRWWDDASYMVAELDVIDVGRFRVEALAEVDSDEIPF